MNTQPYKMILVRDQEKKEALAQYMEGGNSNTVKSSGALVVVCADQRSCLFPLVMSRTCRIC